jgi:chromosomal replication initiator protein
LAKGALTGTLADVQSTSAPRETNEVKLLVNSLIQPSRFNDKQLLSITLFQSERNSHDWYSRLRLRAEETRPVIKDDLLIVSELRTTLASKVGQDNLQLYLGHEQSLLMEQGVLYVRAADQFTLDRIKRKLRAVLVETAQTMLGFEPRVQFLVDATLKSPAALPEKPVSKFSLQQNVFSFLADEESVPLASPATVTPVAVAPAVMRMAAVHEPRLQLADATKQRQGRKFSHLQSFVVGEENRLAHAAAASLAQSLGDISPLYIYGATGTGKTHLLEGIWSAVRQVNAAHRCVYLTSEQFTTLFLDALHGKGLPSFRRKYRDVDLLLIDDIQFLQDKRATLQELATAVDYFASQNKQLVLSADRAPHALTGWSDELITRLAGGMVTEIKTPQADTKRIVLLNYLAEKHWHFSADVVDYLAHELPGDMRLVRGAANRLHTWHLATGQAITIRAIRETCSDLLPTARKMIQLDDIERAINHVFSLPAKSLQSSAKARSIVQPRMLALWLSRKFTRAGLSEIGEHFGLKSHSTVIAAQKKVENWLTEHSSIRIAHAECNIHDAIRLLEGKLRTG